MSGNLAMLGEVNCRERGRAWDQRLWVAQHHHHHLLPPFFVLFDPWFVLSRSRSGTPVLGILRATWAGGRDQGYVAKRSAKYKGGQGLGDAEYALARAVERGRRPSGDVHQRRGK